MKSRTNLPVFLACLAAVLLFLSCTPATGPNDNSNPVGGDGGSSGGTAGSLKFNLTGAKAVGSADIAATKAIRGLTDYRSIKAAMSRATDEYGLVKIKDDGTVELAMEMPQGTWMPKVMFIAKSPLAGSKDLYVAFEQSISFFDKDAQKQVNLGSFLHILEDGTYYSVIDKENGRVKNYSWYGNDNYKPVSFDSAGNLYFVFETWGSSTSTNQLFQYNPGTHTSKALTPALSGMQYNNFEVSPDGSRLFVQGQRMNGGTSSNFFRMYPLADVENPVTIYYSSSSNIWVRGYKVSPAGVAQQNIILNGYGIRGINGLLRANVISDSSITYDPLFDSGSNSGNGNWFTPDYNEWYSDWEAKTYYNGYFDNYQIYNMYVMMTDGTDKYYVRVGDLKSSIASPYKYNTGLYSLYNLTKTPMSNDWSSNVNKDLKPAGTTSLFGFAQDVAGSTTGAVEVMKDTLATDWNGSSAISTDVQYQTYTIKTYWDHLTAAQKAKLKVYNVQYRYNNGTNTQTMVDSSPDLLADTALLATGTSSVYAWNSHWLNTDGTLKKAEVIAYASKYFMDDVKFKYLTNAAGDASLDAFFAKKTYAMADILGASGTASYMLDTYFVKASDGTTPAITFNKYKTDNNLQWLNFQNVSSLFYDGTNAVWAIIGGNMWGGSSATARPVKILDSNGKKTLAFIPALNANTYNPVSYLMSGNRLFFRDGLKDVDGFESGYHKMYMLDVTAPSVAPVDVLANVPENGKLEIVAFSVAGDLLYFTGVKGTGVVGGKIDLTTFAYTPLSGDYLLKDIQVY